MRMTYLLPALTSAALLLTGTAALARQAESAPAAAAETGGTAPAAKSKEKKICRANGSSYSHMVSRTCKTQAEWDKEPQRREADSRVRSADPNH